MWTLVKPFLVLLSVALNGAFLAAWMVRAVPGHPPAEVTTNEEDCCLIRKIGASEAQARELRPRLIDYRNACQSQCREITAHRRELIDLLAAGRDRAAIQAKQEEILAGHRQMQDLVVNHLLALKASLTPQQQSKLFQLLRQQCGCSEGSHQADRTGDPSDCAETRPGSPTNGGSSAILQGRS